MKPISIFISYAREDRAAARRLFADFRKAGAKPWLDEESLLPGERWKSAVQRAIQNSQYFVAVLSSRSVSKRGYVQKELREALEVLDQIPESDIYVIPLRLDECEAPEYFNDLHRADLFPSWSEGLDRVLRAMGLPHGMPSIERISLREGFRIATFNLDNFDYPYSGDKTVFEDRIAVLQPQLFRLNADVLCLQEVNAQGGSNGRRQLAALTDLLSGTPYADYHCVASRTSSGDLYAERNLVIVSRFEILDSSQHKNDLVESPAYRTTSAAPADLSPQEVSWDRPVLYAKLKLSEDHHLHVFNIHLKSKIPTAVRGQMLDNYTWKTTFGYAEGNFVSVVKRVGQAMEVRGLVDRIFSNEGDALLAVCGSMNADAGDEANEIICGDMEGVGNEQLLSRRLVLAEAGIADSKRYSLLHRGKAFMVDHVVLSQALLTRYRYSEVHNENLIDSVQPFSPTPYSDHAPVVAEFDFS